VPFVIGGERAMKKVIGILTMCLISFLYTVQAEAGPFISGSTGADGPFNPPTTVPAGTTVNGNTVIVPLPASGIFNFTTIDIATGMTVKFQRNATNTPVYILTTADVNVSGTVDISGGDGARGDSGNVGPAAGGKGGPGGFDGGYGGVATNSGSPATPGYGLGPGGGNPCIYGIGGSFATPAIIYAGCSGPANTYGNSTLIPLIGGSGGAGGLPYNYGTPPFNNGGGGGGGGGAILIASSGNINIAGAIKAIGGNGGNQANYMSGGGSGGAIRLMGNNVTANNPTVGGAILFVSGGNGGNFAGYTNPGGGSGRIRIEAYSSGGIVTDQSSQYNLFPSITTPTIVFLPQIPSLSIVNIAGVPVPASAAGSYGNPDISLPSVTANPVAVQVAATNIPAGTTITVQAVPQSDIPSSSTATLSGSTSSSTATASVNISMTYPTIITAQTIFAVQTAMYWEGEKIDKVRVASAMGKQSQAVYITESGKEIPAAKLFASLTK
jgi:hypothetical protein